MNAGNGLRTFEGAVSMVTGGARGIGQALSEALVRRGSEVVLADRDRELAEATAAGIRNRGGIATAVELDVRDSGAFERVIQDTADRCGRLDYLFNNAGICLLGDVRIHGIDDWDRVLDVNLRGVVHGIHAAYPIMLRQSFGHIVNTASMAGLVPVPLYASYTASKYAVVGLSEALRVEAAAAGIRVTVLCPGVIRTPALEDGGKFGGFLEPMSATARQNIWKGPCPMPPEEFATKAIRGVAKNKAIVVVPFSSRLVWWINCLAPSLGRYLVRKTYEARKRGIAAQ